MRVWLHILSAASLILYSGISQAQSYNGDDFKEDVREALPYAKLSQLSYGQEHLDNKEAGVHSSLDRIRTHDGWEEGISRTYKSGLSYTYFYKDNEWVVAFRGTEFSDTIEGTRDVLSNASGVQRKQVEDIVLPELHNLINARFRPPKVIPKVTFTGHSLGGQLAAVAGVKWHKSNDYITSGGTAIKTFNAHMPPVIAEMLEEDVSSDIDIINFRVEGDPVNNIGTLRDIGIMYRDIGKTIIIDDADGIIKNNNKLTNKLVKPLANHAIDTTINVLTQVANSKDVALSLSGRLVNNEADVTIDVPAPDPSEIISFLASRTQNPGAMIGSPAPYTDIRGGLILADNYDYEYNENNTNYNVRKNYNTDGVIVTGPVDVLLSWGNNPSDLDSHLTVPQQGGGRFHVNSQQPGSLNSPPNAFLHTDYKNHSPGNANLPEQTRITQLREGVYRFYVHDFSNINEARSTELSSSGARVSIHHSGRASNIEGQGIGAGLANIKVPEERTGNTWHAFELDSRTSTFISKDEFRDIPRVPDVPFNN